MPESVGVSLGCPLGLEGSLQLGHVVVLRLGRGGTLGLDLDLDLEDRKSVV